ncbi:MAG TPA: guanylate kinase [Perlabentimonas sp.]|nr:guanylate kinase [Bacteroidales bacterium]MDD4673838.1 guanylate kinase [Bacteroidales bacterium]MDY0348644.1 guanylate kinase [Tenuifilaceae bacterium]HZJ73584.1 guanylate kinase [Perlabentimonas sp.]
MAGKLVIFSAPSGSGKTTIVRSLLQKMSNLEFSISACSREMRKCEVYGHDYYFLSPDEFKAKIDNNEFVEWEEVYTNSYYGTLKSELERIWAKGNHVAFDVDVKGGINLKKQFGDRALSIFIKPPSIEELQNRLEKRSTETPESLAKRLGKASEEMTYANKFDKIIVNDKLEEAIIETEEIVKKFIQ